MSSLLQTLQWGSVIPCPLTIALATGLAWRNAVGGGGVVASSESGPYETLNISTCPSCHATIAMRVMFPVDIWYKEDGIHRVELSLSMSSLDQANPH